MARLVCGGTPPPSRARCVSFGNGLWPPLTAEPLYPLRSAIKGQARACPDRTRAISCSVREVSCGPPSGLQFRLQFTAVQSRPGRTGQACWSSLNRSERPRPELLMRLGNGSHAGSHTDERPRDSQDLRGQPALSRPKSRTDLNGPGCLHGNLRIKRLGVRIPPSAPSSEAGSDLGTGLLHASYSTGVQQPTGWTRSGLPGWPRWACCARRSCRRRRSGRCAT
jgi:hypothetical protein